MNHNEIPESVKNFLAGPTYHRSNQAAVSSALTDLGVEHALLRSFLERYEGPFWSENMGCELMDLCEDEETIKSATELCRRQFRFPQNFLVLTKLSAGQVVVLNTVDDKVYEVDFEGGEKLLLQGKIEPRWNHLHSFLIEFFAQKITKGARLE